MQAVAGHGAAWKVAAPAARLAGIGARLPLIVVGKLGAPFTAGTVQRGEADHALRCRHGPFETPRGQGRSHGCDERSPRHGVGPVLDADVAGSLFGEGAKSILDVRIGGQWARVRAEQEPGERRRFGLR